MSLTRRVAQRFIKGRQIPDVVYHATPYPKSILRNGFELRSEQTFGGHEAEYISVTTEENAKTYAAGLQLTVAFLRRELNWYEFKKQLKRRFGINDGDWREALQLADLRYWIEKKSPGSIDDYLGREPDDFAEHLRIQREIAMEQLAPNGEPTDPNVENGRRWVVIDSLWQVSDYPLFFSSGIGPPDHFFEIDPSSIGIVEARVRSATELGEERGYGDVEDGTVTYNSSEDEWRFHDPELLNPIDVIWNF